MTRGEMISQLFIPLDKTLGYVRAKKWEIPSGGFDAWCNGCKTPGYDRIDIPYVIDCVQVRCVDIHSALGYVDIFHDRVIFTYFDDDVENSKIDLTPFLDKGLTEENLFQYDVAYGFEGVTPRDLSIICMIAKLLVPPTENDAYTREMSV